MSERDDDLLRRYRTMAREAPAASVDAAILAASRDAVRPRRASRWAVPVSVAAVVVLALGLVLKVQREAPEESLPAQVTQHAPAPPQSPPAPAQAAPSLPVAPEPATEPKPVVRSPAPARKAEAPSSAARIQPPAAAPPPPT